jgi:uncharacterized membrane protein YfcA
VYFTVAEVEVSPLIPPIIAFCISLFTSLGGISGAFVLLPFQVSILGYTSPSVSATNQLFNVFATPGAVYRYVKEGRMVWPLAVQIAFASAPGVLVGAWMRIRYLPDPDRFKFFAGLVLVLLGGRILADAVKRSGSTGFTGSPEVRETRFGLGHTHFVFASQQYRYATIPLCLLSVLVGILGGAYGIGGGALVAPALTAGFGLPVHAVAGAAVVGTLVTSVCGVAAFHFLAPLSPGVSVGPDWLLGALFGIGGFLGMYVGSRWQKRVTPRTIKLIVAGCALLIGLRYLSGLLT